MLSARTNFFSHSMKFGSTSEMDAKHWSALIAKLSQKQVSHHYQDFLVVGPSVFFAEECVVLVTAQKAL
jgi:hypothetical protein